MKKLIFLLLLSCLSFAQQSPTQFVNISESYCSEGAMGFKDSSVTVDLTQNTWVHVTNSGNNLFGESETSKNIEVINDMMILNRNGSYFIDARLSCTIATKRNLKITIMKNGSILKACNQVEIAANIFPLTTFGKVSVTDAPDTLAIYVNNTESNDDITVYCGALRVRRIRPL